MITKPKVDRLQAIRQAAYERNMNLMREWKESHACADCGDRFPSYVMDFAAPKKGEWSISRLAGSRCTIDVLKEAMRRRAVLCLNCRAIRDHRRK